jgi:hypothetical protein
MPRTRDLRRRTGLAIAAIAIALIATACGSTSTSAGPASASPLSTEVAAASPSMAPTEVPSDAPPPTAVPGGVTVSPGPPATHKPTTTNTDWGVILDAVPDDFPRYPGAKDSEADVPVSAALIAESAVDEVASWYRDALEAAGYATLDLSDPLEDGSRVLDSQTDLPECKVQTTFRPAGGSTMITVLFAAGCVAIGG